MDAAILYFDSISQCMREKDVIKTSPLASKAVSACCSMSSLYSCGDIPHLVRLYLPDGFVGIIIIKVAHHDDIGIWFVSIDRVNALT